MATISPQYTSPAPALASMPSTWATRVATMHGMVMVRSRYDAARTQWTHRIPSHSQRGSYRTVASGACDCPARRQCWHEHAAAAAQASIHEMLWGVLKYEFHLDASMESYGRGLDCIRRMHIPIGGYRQTRAATITAMEALR